MSVNLVTQRRNYESGISNRYYACLSYQSRIRDTDTTTVAGDATYATDVCSKKKLRANIMRMRITSLFILTLNMYLFFINIWVGYLNNTKCIDKGFLVL